MFCSQALCPVNPQRLPAALRHALHVFLQTLTSSSNLGLNDTSLKRSNFPKSLKQNEIKEENFVCCYRLVTSQNYFGSFLTAWLDAAVLKHIPKPLKDTYVIYFHSFIYIFYLVLLFYSMSFKKFWLVYPVSLCAAWRELQLQGFTEIWLKSVCMLPVLCVYRFLNLNTLRVVYSWPQVCFGKWCDVYSVTAAHSMLWRWS